jgi:membrane-bound transcription factor site-1 protease
MPQESLSEAPVAVCDVQVLGARKLWDLGYDGSGIRVAILDTGLDDTHPHFRRIKERTNWTFENTLLDKLGHGTFVAGVVAGTNPRCLGFAPNSDLHIFKVFTNGQQSYTSWFLDAFNYAIFTNIHVLNLSIGGPDFKDQPFIDKILEMGANGIVVVSAIGNDGPLYGTLNNPADQLDVLGVGGIDFQDEMASFSSRGMSLWELPHGYGRFKPDVVTYGKNVWGSAMNGGCRALSGTSVASPVATGIVTLLASTVKPELRSALVTPASIKQAVTSSAVRLGAHGIFEQGQGRIDIYGAYEFLKDYKPHATVLPRKLDFTDCPYMWPYCNQPFYRHMQPIRANLTVVNGMGIFGNIEAEPIWVAGNKGHLLNVSVSYSPELWPWSGYLAVEVVVAESADIFEETVAEGVLRFTVVSPPAKGSSVNQRSTVELPIRASLVPTPPRRKRLLWDQFRSRHYPPAFFPRDHSDSKDMLDWNGDHLHTNFRTLFNQLTAAGYFVEILTKDYSCFDAIEYAALLIVDPEQDFFEVEQAKLWRDVVHHDLGLVVVAEWYNEEMMRKLRFLDDNTNEVWDAVTGGANLPALNLLLAMFNISFSDSVYRGRFFAGGQSSYFATGTSIGRFPAGGYGLRASNLEAEAGKKEERPLIAALSGPKHAAKLALLGDSSCFDDASHHEPCHQLMLALVQHAATGVRDTKFFGDETRFVDEYIADGVGTPLPAGDARNTLGYISILEGAPMCSAPSALRGALVGASNSTISEPRPMVLLHVPTVVKKNTAAQPFRLAAEKMFVLSDYERIGSVALGVLGVAFVFFLVFSRRAHSRKPSMKGVPRVLRPPPELPSQV